MRSIILIASLLCFASIGYGFYLKEQAAADGDFYIGLGTACLFLIVMPVFVFRESKGKKMKDYSLTKENIEKMRENQEKP